MRPLEQATRRKKKTKKRREKTLVTANTAQFDKTGYTNAAWRPRETTRKHRRRHGELAFGCCRKSTRSVQKRETNARKRAREKKEKRKRRPRDRKQAKADITSKRFSPPEVAGATRRPRLTSDGQASRRGAQPLALVPNRREVFKKKRTRTSGDPEERKEKTRRLQTWLGLTNRSHECNLASP